MQICSGTPGPVQNVRGIVEGVGEIKVCFIANVRPGYFSLVLFCYISFAVVNITTKDLNAASVVFRMYVLCNTVIEKFPRPDIFR